MQTQRRVWNIFQQYNVVSLVVSTYVVAALGLNMFGSTQRAGVAQAQSAYICSHTDPTNDGIGSHTAVERAMHPDGRLDVPIDVSGTSDPAVISANQQCIAGKEVEAVQSEDKALNVLDRRAQLRQTGSHFVAIKQKAPIAKVTDIVQQASTSLQSAGTSRSRAAAGSSNPFPFGQCVWWADQRYYQLHGIFVPWRINAMAANWVHRAREFGWHVSGIPKVGSILVLQPGIQGAYSAGHVAVVEHLLNNGSVVASSMNWGRNPTTVTDNTFRPGPGVAFISQED